MGSRWGVLPLRIVLGLVFVVHGAQKLFGFGLAGTAGFLGEPRGPASDGRGGGADRRRAPRRLALLLGAWTRIVAALLAADMLVAILTVHLRGGFFVPDGVEFVLTLLGGCVALVGLGAGPWSVDAARRRDG